MWHSNPPAVQLGAASPEPQNWSANAEHQLRPDLEISSTSILDARSYKSYVFLEQPNLMKMRFMKKSYCCWERKNQRRHWPAEPVYLERLTRSPTCWKGLSSLHQAIRKDQNLRNLQRNMWRSFPSIAVENVSQVLKKYLDKRMTCSTPSNATSSRSHFVIQFNHLTLVDLPGSEPYSGQELLKDKVNSSLFFLKQYLTGKVRGEVQTGRDWLFSKFISGNVAMFICLNAGSGV